MAVHTPDMKPISSGSCWQVLGIEGSDCAWSFVDRMFLANELLDAADAAGKHWLAFIVRCGLTASWVATPYAFQTIVRLRHVDW